ncbi:MAG: hypothetical protein M1829_006367 [Trizodia sp. TS-e1964]|nr:MAG: hypothetical protein M1829_006367 [Trizodia sp. TS-e1964]
MSQDFKLKLSSLSLKAGELCEVEVEGIEEAKVLLANIGGKTHAVSPKCTHYGAPLVKGVLSSSGRLVCPWHGACFNAITGDVEDAPALDGLTSYPLVEKNGSLYIQSDEATIKRGRRTLNAGCSLKGEEKVVIVGGGSGATGALEGLREGGYTAPITVISEEDYRPIDRTKLSKSLVANAQMIALRNDDWYASAHVKRITDTVTKVDFANKTVTSKNGSYGYTKLILASGGTPKRLPLPGFKELKNIFVLRSVPDNLEIQGALGDAKGRKVVIVGSSFIGMEIGNCLSKDHKITIIGMEKVPLERIMGAAVGAIVQGQLEKKGVKFYMDAGVEKALPSATKPGFVGAVQLKDGTQLEADIVILGVGIGLNTEYLKESKEIKLNPDGSIQTNEHFAVGGLEHVYAVGDIASFPYHGPGGEGKPTRIEHWNVAQNAGRTAAAHIISPSSKALPRIPIFWSALASQLRYCGNTQNGWDDLVIKGQPEEGKFTAYFTKGDIVVAVATMGMDPVMSKSAELLSLGKMPAKAEIQKGANVLEIEL